MGRPRSVFQSQVIDEISQTQLELVVQYAKLNHFFKTTSLLSIKAYYNINSWNIDLFHLSLVTRSVVLS